MKKTLYDYKDKVSNLPLKSKYSKEKLLIEDFLIVCRSKYVMLARLGACDGATDITYLLLIKSKSH